MKLEEVQTFLLGTMIKSSQIKAQEIADKMRGEILTVHKTFFQYLVSSSTLIGRKSPIFKFRNPTNEPLMSPITWPYLTKKYNARKKRNKDKFFQNTGKLKTDLNRLSTNTRFGAPSIYYQNETNTTSKSRGQVGRVVIDLYPRIGRLQATPNSEFYMQAFGGLSSKIGYKLGHAASQDSLNDRPFMGHYMEWWLKVKIKNKILKRGF